MSDTKRGFSEAITNPYPMAKGYIGMTDPTVATCQDCRNCEMNCAVVHDHACGLTLNRIWQTRDVFHGEYGILACKQCIAPSCMAACPVDAFYIDKKTGARCIDTEKCTGCMECIKACPLDPPRINFDPVRNVALKCDLCKDRPDGPVCVQFCPVMCLELKKY